jgi:hypothetical protein
MNFENNQVVKNRKGEYGVVASWNNKPKYIVYQAYIQKVDAFDENLRYTKGSTEEKRREYDIVEIYDGTPVENADTVFKSRKYNADGLTLLWKEETKE